MATWFLSINRGQLDGQTGNVAVATSAPTADMYLQISTANTTPTKKDVLLAMEAFGNYLNGNGLPGGQTGVDLPPL